MRMNSRTLPLALALLALGLTLPSAARASVVEKLPLPELSRRADSIVVGQVLFTETQWSEDHAHLFRRVHLQVEERWKGQGGAELVLLLRGGVLDGIQEHVVGVPDFADGARAVFFLRQRGELHTLVGLGQGALELTVDGQGREWATPRVEELSLAAPNAAGQMELAPHGAGGLAPLRLEALKGQVLVNGAAR